MVGVQASLFIYMAIGYVLRKRNMTSKQFRSELTNILVNILLPCMVFDSFQQDVSMDQLMSGVAILGLSFFLSFLAWWVGWLFFRNYPPEKAKILRYGTLIANSGFAGLPVIQGAYGGEGLFLASIYIIPNRVLMWSAGISLFTKGEKSDFIKKVLLNPGIIAVFLGLGWMLLDLPLPGFCASAIGKLGDSTAPLSLLIVGSILADVDWRGIFERDVLLVSGVRLLLLPAVSLIILKVIGFSSLGTAIAVILTGMPIGSTTAILAEKYGADALFASKCVFLSTLFSLITIPVLTLFL